MSQPTPRRAVAAVDAEGKLAVDTEQFLDVWSDGTTLKDTGLLRMDDDTDGWQLVVRGTTADGNCHAIRTPIDFTPDGQVELSADEGKSRASQSCSGSPCESCKILASGGCACRDVSPSHTCNHTVTSLFELPTFLKQ